MAKPGMLGQITEEFEQIGKQIVTETVQAPKDIVGKAMESLGAGGGKKPKQSTQAQQANLTPEQQEQTQKDLEIKKAVARAALAELAGGQKQKQQSIYEKQKQEEEQKKEQKKAQAEAQRKTELPKVSSKRKRGDLFGMKAKKSSTEIGKNVRQD